MNKCKKCGQEYEGNFCPNCGASVDGREASGGSGGLVMVYNALSFVPAVLIALFTILLLAFFSSPVAVMGGEEAGIEVSFGNLYSMFGKEDGILVEMPDLKVSLILLIAAVVIGVICTAVAVKFTLKRYDRVVEKRLFDGFSLSASGIASCIAGVIAFVFALIAGIITTAKISELDEGMGIIKAGACPVLVIVFAIVFVVLMIASVIIKKVMCKKVPDCKKSDGAFLAQVEEYMKQLPAPEKPEMSQKLADKMQGKGSDEEIRAAAKAKGKNMCKVAVVFLVATIVVGIVAGMFISKRGFSGGSGMGGMFSVSYMLLLITAFLLAMTGWFFQCPEAKYFWAERKYDKQVKLYGEGKNYAGSQGFTEWLNDREDDGEKEDGEAS